MADRANTTPDLAIAASIVQAHHNAMRQGHDPGYMEKFANFAESIFDNPQTAFEIASESVFDAAGEPNDVVMAENLAEDVGVKLEVGASVEPDPPKVVPDRIVEVDGIAIEEFSAVPPPLPRPSAEPSSSQLVALRPSDLPATKSRPTLIRCDRCLKWRQIDVPIWNLAAQWTCPPACCNEEEDFWAAKSNRIVPFHKLSLPTPEQEQQQLEEQKKIQAIFPQLPQYSRTYSYADNHESNGISSVESIFWVVPKAFIDTEEKKQWYTTLQNKLLQKGQLTRSFPKIGPLKQPVDLYALFYAVRELSTSACSMNDIWVQAALQLNLEVTATALRACYMRFLQHLTPIRNFAIRENSQAPAKRGRPSLSSTSPSAVNHESNQTDLCHFSDMLTMLTERVSSLEQIVGRLVDAHQITSLEALQSIKERVVELSESVHQSNVIMEEFLPECKTLSRHP